MKVSVCDSCLVIGDFVINKISAIIISILTVVSFLLSYFGELTIIHHQQYIAVISVVFLDGIFGIIAGTKKEGFKTYKALKVLRTAFTWVAILTVLLTVENGIDGTNWLSETVIIPFVVFQLISALKNASMAGYIQYELLNQILDKLDKHKGVRGDKKS